MRVAGLFDVHGNLPALEAALDDARRERVDLVVVGGDVIPGPMPREALARLLALDVPTRFVHGNGDLAVRAQMSATDPAAATYWGTASGAPLPEPARTAVRWSAEQLPRAYDAVIASWPKTVRLEIPGIGPMLFCHGTPRSETEIFTRTTPEERLLPIFEPLGVSLIVCGHTHMQFDRQVGRTRVVNAGSVGMPIGAPGAHWVLLGPDVELRRTPYDYAAAATRVRATGSPGAEDAARAILQPPAEDVMLAALTKAESK
jgi:predicted phosphodiesterase